MKIWIFSMGIIRKALAWISSGTFYSFLVGIVIFYACLSGCRSKQSDPGLNTVDSKKDSVFLFNSEVKVYFFARVWGITGNHEQFEIFSNISSDTIKLFTSEAYYKKAGSDSIIVYAPQSSIPAGIIANIGRVKVNVIGLNSRAEVMDYSTNYHTYELIKISAFDK